MKISAALSAISLAAVNAAQAGIPHDPVQHQDRCDDGVERPCVVSTGWDWSACSVTCGEGIIRRDRTIVHEPCNGGMACPDLHQNRACLVVVCECEKVVCSYDQQHTCGEYTDAAGNTYHSVDYLHGNKKLDPNDVMDAEHRKANTNAFVSKYDTDAVDLDRYLSSYGAGDEHGAQLGPADTHDAASACAPSDSVRVYHHNEESIGCAGGGACGHHCKNVKGGACTCRCDSLFQHGNGYNPLTEDLFHRKIDDPAPDAATIVPTSYPTASPTPFPDYLFATTNAGGAWDNCNDWETVDRADDCPIDCSVTTITGDVTVTDPDTVHKVVIDSSHLLIDGTKLTLLADSTTCCDELHGFHTQLADRCRGD